MVTLMQQSYCKYHKVSLRELSAITPSLHLWIHGHGDFTSREFIHLYCWLLHSPFKGI